MEHKREKDMQGITLQQLWQQYQQFRAQRDTQQISQQQFIAQVRQLQACDENGTWWMIDPQAGTYLRFDGARWVPGMPGAPSAAAPPPKSSRATGCGCGNITRFMGLVVPLIIAGFWTLYTSIPGHSEGVDLITPLIVGGIPLALWKFRRQVDALLLPFEPIRSRYPRPLLMGVAFALPVVLGWMFASFGGGSGYGSIRFTSLLSILGAHALTRKPEVQL